MFSEKRYVHWTLHGKSRCGKTKGSRQMRSNTTVSLMSTVFYTVSFCSLWKFLLKIAKNKVLCKDVRFFETWNALINRLDEINLKVPYSLNIENYQKKKAPTGNFSLQWKRLLSRKTIISSHANTDIYS